eukprot:scaffold37608_cov44-Attheya_sp.AAC.1
MACSRGQHRQYVPTRALVTLNYRTVSPLSPARSRQANFAANAKSSAVAAVRWFTMSNATDTPTGTAGACAVK